jgi:hypothetical protein
MVSGAHASGGGNSASQPNASLTLQPALLSGSGAHFGADHPHSAQSLSGARPVSGSDASVLLNKQGNAITSPQLSAAYASGQLPKSDFAFEELARLTRLKPTVCWFAY